VIFMMGTRIKRTVAAGSLALVAAGFGSAALAAHADAQTTACTSAASGECGAQVNVNDNALTVKAATPAVNGAVTATPLDTTSGSQDFVASQTTSNPDERVFFYAPGGVQSKYVISNVSGRTVALRKYNARSLYQRWTGLSTRDTSGTQWSDNATGSKLQANGTGARVIALPNPSNRNGSFWGFQSAATIPSGS
jgi:hypothetical protein